ncbi:hypothetical protein HYH03_018354 [Edaphochlamys debaryana]|uniref:FAS1 domain-containing protein n=1 Tax=Edaphochlamys debaryana TaxID=47281 RepID=A0A835XGN6_9CHLO|nr:hypothetical protein HYH03_018354 [Edaphochlamys debaryana]|eukprot:KAG2482722.1 hypothetical protein HYH03_018354 [Edaphochlamys debaryana]
MTPGTTFLRIKLVLCLVAVVQGGTVTTVPVPPPCSAVGAVATLQELASACPDLSTFSRILDAAGNYGKVFLECGKQCSQLGQLERTVFVPVNVAWNRYFAATGTTLEDLLSKRSRKALTSMVKYHVLPHVVPAAAVQALAPPPTVAGLVSDIDGISGVGRRALRGRKAANGTLPPSPAPPPRSQLVEETLQGAVLKLERRASNLTGFRVRGLNNDALALRTDISFGKVGKVRARGPPAERGAAAGAAAAAPARATGTTLAAAALAATARTSLSYVGWGDPAGTPSSPRPLGRPFPLGGSTVFNLTWGRDVDMDLIVVTSLPEGGTMTMFYGYPGPEALIGGGVLSPGSGSPVSGPMTGFYSRTAGSWEALKWVPGLKPITATYTVCSFFYNLEWAPGTLVDGDHPVVPTLSVTTDSGGTLVGSVSRPLTQPGQFTFTLVPRNCVPGCPWYLAQVCVDASRVRVVTGDERC